MRDSSDCSSGRNTLTSPLEGLSVPTSAISISGQKSVTSANPRPVPAISSVDASSQVR